MYVFYVYLKAFWESLVKDFPYILFIVALGIVIQPLVPFTVLAKIAIPISLVATAVALFHFVHYSKARNELGDSISLVFKTDALLYLLTNYFAVGAMLGWFNSEFWWGYYLRNVIILLNAYASIRMAKYILNLKVN